MEPAQNLQQIADEVATCEKCSLHFSRKKSVPGEGPTNAKIMLIGEGPGFYENEQGRPFVGPSGQFLAELLQSAGLKRPEVFIGNVVKCRPPQNRDPLPDELLACRSYLERQIEAINPEVFITLGRFSMAHFLPGAKISLIHGKPTWIGDKLVVPMYHPAAALHQPALRDSVVKDFASLPAALEQARKQKTARTPSAPVKAPVELQKPAAFDFQQMDKPVEWSQAKDKKETEEDDSGPVQLSLF